MDNSFTSNHSPGKQSIDPSEGGQFSDSGSPESGTEQSSNTQMLSVDGRLNKFLLSSQQLLLKTDNLGQVTSGINQLILLSEKINFLRNNNRNYDPKLQMICYYNISCGYQILTFNKSKSNVLEQCLKFLHKSIELNKKIQMTNEKQMFKFKELKVRMNLQFCALLSQSDSHKKALEVSIQALNDMKWLFIRGYELCCSNLDQMRASGDEKVSFTQNVLKKAKQLLDKLKKIQNFQEIVHLKGHEKESIKKLKEKNYFWESNFENNEKALRKQLNNETQQGKGIISSPQFGQANPIKSEHIPNRNILGVKVSNDWIQQFTIGKIMHMVPLKYQYYTEQDNVIYELSYRNLIEKVFLASAIYFSIATEMRFLEGNLEVEKKREREKVADKLKKKEEEKKSEIEQSELFHLKSIQTICKHVKESSSFTDHLINSYHRHYNPILATIEQQPSFAEYSMMSSLNARTSNKGNKPIKTDQKSINQDYDESCTFLKKEAYQKKDTPALIFTRKNHKQKNLMESGELDRDFSRSSKFITNKAKSRAFNKIDDSRKKSEKSISSTHFHSMKSADKKSFSIKKENMTVGIKSKSPEPSFKNIHSGRDKSASKKSNIRFTRR